MAQPVTALEEDLYRARILEELAVWRPEDFEALRLRPLLHDQNPAVRADAALVTGQIRESGLIEELTLLSEDEAVVPIPPYKEVAVYAHEALDRIAGKRELWKPAVTVPVRTMPVSEDNTRDEPAPAQFLQDLFEQGRVRFNTGDWRGAIQGWDLALRSFVTLQHDAKLRGIYQKIWAAKATAHQQLKQYPKAREAARIANALLQSGKSETDKPKD